jgi:membrane protein
VRRLTTHGGCRPPGASRGSPRDQNELDHEALLDAIASGRIKAEAAAQPAPSSATGWSADREERTLTLHRLRALEHRLETSFLGRCIRQFVALQGLDRGVVLASQAFTALIPLLVLVTALAPGDDRDAVSAAIIRRFELNGSAADSMAQLFAHSGNGATGVLSVFLLFFSGVSLAKRLQRLYQQAWGLEAWPGVGRALNAALGLTVLVLGISLLYFARTLLGGLPAGDVLVTPVFFVSSFLLWSTVPWLLLERRVAWRRFIPAGALTATCATAYGVASTIYMPRQLESYSERYGLFGVTLALIGWLLGMSLIIVASTAVASTLDRAQDPWARRIRRATGVEPVAGVEEMRLSGPAQSPSSSVPPSSGTWPRR